MNGGGEFVELPQFVRQIRVSSQSVETDSGDAADVSGASATSPGFSGVLSPFGGVLQVGVTTGEWPSPALSHLVLGELVERSLSDDDENDQPSDDDSMVEIENPESEDDESELRVRDLVRSNADRSPPAASDHDVGLSTSDPARPLPIRAVTDAGSRPGSTATSSDQQTITTNRPSTAVVQRHERPELTVTRQAPTVTRPAPGTTDPPGSTGEDRERASERPSLETVTATQSMDTESGTDQSVDSTDTPRLGSRSDLDHGAADTEVVSSPRQDRQTGGDSEVGTGMSRGQPNRDTVGRPPMAVRHAPEAHDATRTTDSPTGRNGRMNTSDEAASSHVDGTQVPPEQATHPHRIDDVVDVERLADRLSRVFERKARIERERRGR